MQSLSSSKQISVGDVGQELNFFLKNRRETTTSITMLEQRMQRQRDKLGVEVVSKEARFNQKMKEFTKLDTFVDVKQFLQDLNVVNNQQAFDQHHSLRKRLESIQRVEQLSELRKNQPHVELMSYGYKLKLQDIQSKIAKVSRHDLVTSNAVDKLRSFNSQVQSSVQDHKRKMITEKNQRESDDPFYEGLLDQLTQVAKSAEVEKGSANRELFGVDFFQQEEKLKLSLQLQHLDKNLQHKLVSTALLKNEVKPTSQEYYKEFQRKSKNAIHLLQKRQISELKARQDEFEHMSMFSKKRAQPKKLVLMYKTSSYPQLQRHHKQVIRRNQNTEPSHHQMLLTRSEMPRTIVTEPRQSKGAARLKFQRVVQKIVYLKTKNVQSKMNYILQRIKSEIDDGHKLSVDLESSIAAVMTKNKEQLMVYDVDRQLESLQKIEHHTIKDMNHIDKLISTRRK